MTDCARIYVDGYRLAIVDMKGRKWGYYILLELPLVRRKISITELNKRIVNSLTQVNNGREYPMNRLKSRLRELKDKHTRFYGAVPKSVQDSFRSVDANTYQG